MDSQNIVLSELTKALISSLAHKSQSTSTLEGDHFEVSQTVSFMGFLYERLRNAVEFNEEHLIRRMAIARILRRRLAINPQGKGEGENLMRELLWGRYLLPKSTSMQDVSQIQKIIDRYLYFLHQLNNQPIKKSSRPNLKKMVTDFLSCEIEETLNDALANRRASSLYFFYQSLKARIEIPGVSEEALDLYFYVAAEEAFLKNDKPYIQYHIFTLHYGPLHDHNEKEIQSIAKSFDDHLAITDKAMKNSYRDGLTKFAKKQAAPFRIFLALLDQTDNPEKILDDQAALKSLVDKVCTEKYAETGMKIRNAAIKSVIYIFFTKMLFVLVLEVPVSRYVFGELKVLPLVINTLFPPLLMGLIVTFINPPSQKNTGRIYEKIIDIITTDPGAVRNKIVLSTKSRLQQPSLLFLFTIVYVITFTMTFSLLYLLLEMIGFNIISKAVFIFFICVIAFFGYRIRQAAKEYVLETTSNTFISLLTFLFLPILYVGKWLSSKIARINLFIIFFDSLIETPFKFLIQVLEEWVRFIKARKDELI